MISTCPSLVCVLYTTEANQKIRDWYNFPKNTGNFDIRLNVPALARQEDTHIEQICDKEAIFIIKSSYKAFHDAQALKNEAGHCFNYILPKDFINLETKDRRVRVVSKTQELTRIRDFILDGVRMESVEVILKD